VEAGVQEISIDLQRNGFPLSMEGEKWVVLDFLQSYQEFDFFMI
jgi:hypothetical protein